MTAEGEFSEESLDVPRVTVDEFGVPANILGPHPEEFFSLLGRIVALSSVLESNVRVFCEYLAGLPQRSLASTPFKHVVTDARKNIERFSDSGDRSLAEDFLRRAEAAVLGRHTYVHSLWPAQAGDVLFGWKQPRKRSAAGIDTTSTTLAEMREDVRRFVELCEVPYWHRMLGLVSSGYHLRNVTTDE